MVPFILVLIILSLFITITPGAFDEKTVLFLALLIAASWHIIRLSTYKIILYDDKMVECLWWRKRNFYYKNIKHIVINGADFDAAKVGECLGAKKVNKYRIYDIYIVSDDSRKLYFKTKWFTSLESANRAVFDMVRKCDASPATPELIRRISANWTISMLVRLFIWIIVIFPCIYYAVNYCCHSAR